MTTVFCGLCSPAPAAPSVNTKMQYYSVHGSTAKAVRQSINAARPSSGYDAYTAWHVTWNYQTSLKTGATTTCSIKSATATVDVTMTLPQWVNENSASPQLRNHWNRYYSALVSHENGHAQFGLQAAQAMEQALLNLGSRKNCGLIQQDADQIWNKIYRQYANLNNQFDRDTAHGTKQGAVFP